jgi:hypothetical protein
LIDQLNNKELHYETHNSIINAIARSGDNTVLPTLIDQLNNKELHYETHNSIIDAIANFDDRTALQPLDKILSDGIDDRDTHIRIIHLMRVLGDRRPKILLQYVWHNLLQCCSDWVEAQRYIARARARPYELLDYDL